MNGSNGMNGSMSTNGATAKGDAMGTVPAATPKFTDSPEQAAVIQAPSYEDVVVVAGAGSGKTYTMTRRIITLIDQGISPEKILGLTFTRKAASELLSRVSAAVTRNQAGRGTRVAFLKPEVSTYDAFFQTIVRQYGLLVGFDQNTQPLSEAGALQLIHTVLDKHMDQLMAFDQGGDELGKFSTIAGNVFTLSNAIAGAMIGSDCTSFDEAVERVRAWDKAFVAQVAKALEDEDVPDDEPKVGKAPKQKKRNPTPPSKPACANTAPNATNSASTRPRNWPARPANATCYSTSWPTTTPKNAPSTWPNSATSPSPHSNSSPDSPPSEPPTANATRTCCSTNTKTPPPRRRPS